MFLSLVLGLSQTFTSVFALGQFQMLVSAVIDPFQMLVSAVIDPYQMFISIVIGPFQMFLSPILGVSQTFTSVVALGQFQMLVSAVIAPYQMFISIVIGPFQMFLSPILGVSQTFTSVVALRQFQALVAVLLVLMVAVLFVRPAAGGTPIAEVNACRAVCQKEYLRCLRRNIFTNRRERYQMCTDVKVACQTRCQRRRYKLTKCPR